MNLLGSFLEKTEFSTYEDFAANFKLRMPKTFNFAWDIVDYYASHAPEKKALVWCDDSGQTKTLTFKQISDLSFIAAAFLKDQGISKGRVVMLALHRHYEYWIFLLALHRLGAVAFPLSSQLTKDEVEERKNLCKAELIITINYLKDKWQPYLDSFEKNKISLPVIDRPDILIRDPMLLYYTSGTQGKPKPVVHNWLYPLAHIVTAKYWQKNIDGGLHYTMAETGWAKASWGKIYGQWICGSAVFVYDRKTFNPQTILQKISDYKVNTFCAPPVIYRYLIELDFSKYDLSSLKHCCSAGESLNQKLAESFYKKTGLRIFEGYGQTETALLCANFDFEDMQYHPGSFGKPSPLYKISLEKSKDNEDNSGEIVIDISKGLPPGLFTNYSESAGKEGFYRTRDIARIDKDGFFYFMGRKDDIIKSAGFRISPFEVENVILKFKAVAECCVFGKSDPVRGQIVAAQIVLKKAYEAGKKLEQELLDFIRENTALYKCPRKIEFVKELAKTYNGKIKRGGIDGSK